VSGTLVFALQGHFTKNAKQQMKVGK